MKPGSMKSLGRVCVAGMGVSGKAVAAYLEAQPSGRVEELVCVDGVDEVPGRFDLIVISPGIAPHTPLFRSARQSTDDLISEIEFAYRESSNRWVGITGTNGKTTTTKLVVHLLEAGDIEAYAVGNIGIPAIEVVGTVSPDAILVAEVSSFQLATTALFAPSVGAILNITPDHLDWHRSLSEYVAEKCKIFANLDPGSLALINGQSEYFAREYECAKMAGAEVMVLDVHREADDPLPTMQIKGIHNVENALFAREIARYFEVDEDTITAALTSFTPVRHRLQYAGFAGGAAWYNDSKATNPDAVIKALSAFSDNEPADESLIVLVGGQNKGNDMTQLAHALVRRPATAVITFGEDGGEIAGAVEAAGGAVLRAETMREAFALAYEHAREGDAVLLSPACASFDEFDNYEARGEAFCALVREHEDER
ncbi:MAG: UDP-N-acetylmuramoyl-L-alanine--D-glutamate ligase [Coriobacteriia bacterium]|nr:UDP-N-acetylmuramoyl-L-alanine--D-glutamate ligase [Coriobacteriia bacterium]